ncbi:hypothetical protein TetV_112 [Tetraselmis virus 1]|uniref:Uncharacterized protein n=1 Tax=Tetraselmis virus 1 TaxID=2060617 RepID=A0A2P0VMS7_9VIRU|nr:hypothetical protein QJ968_gp112 [Tetraselmis virus 1]AUF82204.1 hypothetical protein TetV_112 [Tetraselmis virus 1]
MFQFKTDHLKKDIPKTYSSLVCAIKNRSFDNLTWLTQERVITYSDVLFVPEIADEVKKLEPTQKKPIVKFSEDLSTINCVLYTEPVRPEDINDIK